MDPRSSVASPSGYIRHDTGGFGPGERPARGQHTPLGNRLADRLAILWRIDQRVRRAKLPQAVHVTVADHRFGVTRRPAFRAAIEFEA